MRKRLFLYLLKKYTKNETNRLDVYKVLHSQVCDDYSEQSGFGNIYNAHIEFVMANPLINSWIDDKEDIDKIKSGLENAYDSAIQHIKTEIVNKKRRNKFNRILK